MDPVAPIIHLTQTRVVHLASRGVKYVEENENVNGAKQRGLVFRIMKAVLLAGISALAPPENPDKRQITEIEYDKVCDLFRHEKKKTARMKKRGRKRLSHGCRLIRRHHHPQKKRSRLRKRRDLSLRP